MIDLVIPIHNMGNDVTYGFRVLHVQPHSPAAEAGVQPYTDFILEVNGTKVLESSMSLLDMLQRNLDCPITLTLWSLITQSTRDVKVLLTSEWGGPGVLGARLALQSISERTLHVLRITEVEPCSPAAEAGLKPEEDFIISTAETLVSSADSFASLANSHSELTLAVYSKLQRCTREVKVRPRANWGGPGLLGCQVAEGLLHQLG